MFRQHTVPPTGTLTVCGSKKLSLIATSVEPLGQVGPPTTSFSTLASEVCTSARPPAAMIVLPTATLAVKERAAFNSGTGDQLFVAGSNLETSVRPSKLASAVPPIEYSCPWTTAGPGTFFAIGMFCRACQLLAAMS
jgi:hypothetical protein